VFDLACLNQIFYCSGHIFDGDIRVGTVLVKKINAFDPQTLERGIRYPLDLLRTAVDSEAGVGTLFGIMLPPELGGDHHLSLERFQCFAHQFLVRERSVYFRGVEERDATLDSFVKEIDHLLFVGWSVAKTHSHAAKSKG